MNKTKLDKISSFDPSGVGLASNQIFGLPFNEEESEIVLLPVPWDVTMSYGGASSQGPKTIFEASFQVDLFDPEIPDAWQRGIFMREISEDWDKRSKQLRAKAQKYIEFLEEGGDPNTDQTQAAIRDEINKTSAELRTWVKNQTKELLESGKQVGLIGGDHSTPLGFIDALSEKHKNFAILQIDAHSDLRKAYEGFQYSHASIMWNALTVPNVSKLVQVGIRDYCEAEVNFAKEAGSRVTTFYDDYLKEKMFEGASWKSLCYEIIESLPENVYISFDIDALDPKLCPNTGTPVPGGLEFAQATYLIREVVRSKRRIIGFDLNEVGPDPTGSTDWDANVGARLLYKLCTSSMNLADATSRR